MWWNSQPQHLSRRSCAGWRRPHTYRKAPPPIHAILHEEDCELFVRIRVVRCLSVCLMSVTFVYCSQKSKHILKLFSSWRSHTTSVLSYQTLWQYSDGDPLTGSSNAGGARKIRDFRPISRLVSEMIEVTVIVTTERMRHSRSLEMASIDRWHTSSY